uniref:Reverse transcriptase Ty1/copia-type domain-containing protein n=1 Tax=Fagus sylvatica TaxID=28930 RepID=A0A2N9EFG4_FAGSY
MSRVSYASTVGSMMYAMICTRLDISQAVSVFSSYMANLGKEHWQAIKWILRYLRGTADVGLVYDNASTDSSSVVGFVDSNYVGVTFAGCFVYYRGKVYIATKAVKKAIWLKGLVGDLGLQQGDTLVFCDSQSTIHLTKNQMYHKRPKHIDVRGFSGGARGVSFVRFDRIQGLRAFLVPSLLGRHAKCLEKINNFGANPKEPTKVKLMSQQNRQDLAKIQQDLTKSGEISSNPAKSHQIRRVLARSDEISPNPVRSHLIWRWSSTQSDHGVAVELNVIFLRRQWKFKSHVFFV